MPRLVPEYLLAQQCREACHWKPCRSL